MLKHNQLRHKKGFLFLSKTIAYETRWFVFAEWEERFDAYLGQWVARKWLYKGGEDNMSEDLIKQKYLGLVKAIQDDGHDLLEQPILFRWSWEEIPDIEFQLLIKGLDKTDEVSIPEQDEEGESYSVTSNTIH